MNPPTSLLTKKCLLVDGNAIIHRAYHALPPLTDPEGNVVNAVYGFFSMFLSIIKELDPEYVIVCFDRSKPTHRQALYVGYHQHRPQMASDLVPQIKIIDNALEQLNAAVFTKDGFEADDLIGTISHKIVQETKDVEVIILTGDRDLLQLVNPRVKVLMPIVGVKTTVLYDEVKVEEKYGVKTSQFVDYKALIGDQSDGYPGVSGIGPKTAANLLKEFGSFEALYQKINLVPQKYAVKLATDAEQAALAKQLATIMKDVPLQFDLEKCAYLDFDTAKITNVFKVLGFNSLLKRFSGDFEKLEQKKKEKKSGEQMNLL